MTRAVPRVRDSRLLPTVLVVAVIAEILAVWFVHWIDTRGYIDTGIYRLGAQAWLDGREIYGSDLTPVASPDVGTLPFIYPPFAALLFVPLTWMSTEAAIVTVAVCSHLSLLVTAYALARCSPHLAPRSGLVAGATAVVLPWLTLIEPSRETLNYGQINLVLMALVAADCLLPGPALGRVRWPRGLLVGIAAAIKLTPLVFLLLFVVRKDLRAASVSLLTFSATVLIGFLAAPDDAAAWWLDRMPATGDSFGTVYTGNLTLRSLLAKQEITGTALDALWIAGSLVLLLLAVAGMRHALRSGNTPLALMINAVLGLLVSPISWSHHWVWAGPTLALLFAMALRHRWHGVMLTTGFCAVVVMIGPQWYLPYGDDRELDWTFSQQVVGNAYTLIGIGFLIACAVAWPRLRPRRSHAAADSETEVVARV
ncbi:alpha-1,2-mannosyltransferase [Halopolyspora algeriensis]|uniref:Alpha-1,2-mannosyltransferase n=1 Tax=Halopolyspora algeriensis TaxID=1500506 RepID=A0A368VYN1_9ACTN|nr:glycosyltransferase 87 family protein [Halopolyspora algeriensis]RCW47328.1 alpha-1,2-mannosyltransferase [Halopolyspora algeriensis]TQM42563.1 alpha-1,2-mannosyltransferase [Halopolyspora algeriensis]